MVTNYARSQYQESQVQTTPEHLVVMLYDGAIFALQRAIHGIQQKDLSMQSAGINKAQDILCHLMATLNKGAGPIAEQLESIYRYCLKELLVAHAADDSKKVQAVVELLLPLRESWAEAEKLVAAERAAAIPMAFGAAR